MAAALAEELERLGRMTVGPRRCRHRHRRRQDGVSPPPSLPRSMAATGSRCNAGLAARPMPRSCARLSGAPPDAHPARGLSAQHASLAAPCRRARRRRDRRRRSSRCPRRERPLIVEPAGGLMVPLTRRFLQIDLIARWGMPVVLCAATAARHHQSQPACRSRLCSGAPSRCSASPSSARSRPTASAPSPRWAACAGSGGCRTSIRSTPATLRAAFDRHFDRADFLADAAA